MSISKFDYNGKSFVFEGCSWGCIFFLGLVKALRQQYSVEELGGMKFGGSSSGTLASLGLCLCKSVEECLELYNELAHIGETFGVFGLMSVYHEIVLRRWLPKHGNQYLQLQGRLHVNITRFFNKSDIISDWQSNDDVIDALHASMHIPFYMSYIRPVRDRWGIDGGFSKNLFKIDENTVTVSVTSTWGMIHPALLLTPADCYAPPAMERRMKIFDDASCLSVNPVRLMADTSSPLDDRLPDESNYSQRDVGEGGVKLEPPGPVVCSERKNVSHWQRMCFTSLKNTVCATFWILRTVEAAPFTTFALAVAAVSFQYRFSLSALYKVYCQYAWLSIRKK